jgi:DNA polymerase III epsilon subunit-like protein
MVKKRSRIRRVAADFLDFIGDSVLVAHNAHFDMRFLNHEIGRIYKTTASPIRRSARFVCRAA